MSAISLFREQDRVHIVTDGAGFVGDEVRCHSVKIFPIPHLPAAVAFRGTSTVAQQVWQHIAMNYGRYDEMKQGIADSLRAAFSLRARLFCNLYAFELVVGGFSERTGIDAFLIQSRSSDPNRPAWAVHTIHRYLVTPTYPGSAR